MERMTDVRLSLQDAIYRTPKVAGAYLSLLVFTGVNIKESK